MPPSLSQGNVSDSGLVQRRKFGSSAVRAGLVFDWVSRYAGLGFGLCPHSSPWTSPRFHLLMSDFCLTFCSHLVLSMSVSTPIPHRVLMLMPVFMHVPTTYREGNARLLESSLRPGVKSSNIPTFDSCRRQVYDLLNIPRASGPWYNQPR